MRKLTLCLLLGFPLFSFASVLLNGELPSLLGITDTSEIDLNKTDEIIADPLASGMKITAADLNAKFYSLNMKIKKIECDNQGGTFNESNLDCIVSNNVLVEFYDVDSNKVSIVQTAGQSTCGPSCLIDNLYKTQVIGVAFGTAEESSVTAKCSTNGGSWFGSRYCEYPNVPSRAIIEECVSDNGYYTVINDTISPKCVYNDNIGWYVKISFTESSY